VLAFYSSRICQIRDGKAAQMRALLWFFFDKYTLTRPFFELFMENRTFSLPLTVYWIILKKIRFGKNTKISLILS